MPMSVPTSKDFPRPCIFADYVAIICAFADYVAIIGDFSMSAATPGKNADVILLDTFG